MTHRHSSSKHCWRLASHRKGSSMSEYRSMGCRLATVQARPELNGRYGTILPPHMPGRDSQVTGREYDTPDFHESSLQTSRIPNIGKVEGGRPPSRPRSRQNLRLGLPRELPRAAEPPPPCAAHPPSTCLRSFLTGDRPAPAPPRSSHALTSRSVTRADQLERPNGANGLPNGVSAAATAEDRVDQTRAARMSSSPPRLSARTRRPNGSRSCMSRTCDRISRSHRLTVYRS